LTGYNFFYHNPALGFLFSSQRPLSLLRQLLYSSKSRIACQHFFKVFFTSRVRRPFRSSLFIISSLTYLVNNFLKVFFQTFSVTEQFPWDFISLSSL